MKKFFVLYLLSLSFSFVSAQEKVNMQVMQSIKDEEKNHSYLPRIAHYLTDVSGPRLTNSPGFKRASTWAVETLKSWGLQNAKLEPWGEFGKGWEQEHCTVEMTSPYYKPFISCSIAWAPGTNGPVSAQVVLLDKLDSASITKMGDQLRGKIVLVKTSDSSLRSAFVASALRYSDSALGKMSDMFMFPKSMVSYYINYLLKEYHTEQYLQSVGALGMLSFSPHRDGTIEAEGTLAYRNDFKTTVPHVVIDKEDYLSMQRFLMDGIQVTVNMDVQVKWITDDSKGYDVVAEIPGTDPKLKSQLVMLGGHLDSWHAGTGATDNAAGSAVMMEAVRILTSLGIQPRRTIRIVLWSGEEQGLLGSFGYVKNHFGDPALMNLKPEQKNVSAYYNLDNGSGKIRGIFLQNNEAAKPIFTNWLNAFTEEGASTVSSANTGSTDHLSFDAVGIPAFQFIQDPLDYLPRTHHTNMDLYDHLIIKDLQQAATIVAAFVYNTAMRDEMIPRKPLPKPEKFVFDWDLVSK